MNCAGKHPVDIIPVARTRAVLAILEIVDRAASGNSARGRPGKV